MAKGWRKHDYDVAAFGRRLAASRMEFGWSLQRLAREAGLNPGSLSAAERGQRSLPVATRRALVEVLMGGAAADARAPSLAFDRRSFLEAAGLFADAADATAFSEPTTSALEAVTGLSVARRSGYGAESAPDETSGDDGADAGWQELRDRAEALKRAQAWDAARVAARAAQAVARDGPERSLALVTEAGAWWHLGRHRPALWACQEALNALGLGGAPPEAGTVPESVLAAGDRGLFAYAVAALTLGQIYFRLGRFGIAARCVGVTGRVGELMDDRVGRFEALHMRMRCLVDLGTRAAQDGNWREVRDRGALARAHACLVEAETLGLGATDAAGIGHHDRWKDRVLRLLGRPDEAAVARAAAAAHFAGHPAIYHIHLDQGRLAIEDDAPRLARAELTAALELALGVGHSKTVSDALGSLAYLACVSMTDYREALDLSVAALLAYPYAPVDIDGVGILALCVDLVDYLAADAGHTPAAFWRRYWDGFADAIVAASSMPFDVLAALLARDPGMARRVWEQIAIRLERPHMS